MERLWAPWRMAYIQDGQNEGCVFCAACDSGVAADSLVLYKTALSVVMMNKYPYVNGHLLVLPRRHVGDLSLLPINEQTDLIATVAFTQRILKDRISAEGFNIGMNLGRVAGAGIEDHLHVHIVPRWLGDTNFMTVLNDTRVLPEALQKTFDILYPAFASLPEVKP